MATAGDIWPEVRVGPEATGRGGKRCGSSRVVTRRAAGGYSHTSFCKKRSQRGSSVLVLRSVTDPWLSPLAAAEVGEHALLVSTKGVGICLQSAGPAGSTSVALGATRSWPALGGIGPSLCGVRNCWCQGGRPGQAPLTDGLWLWKSFLSLPEIDRRQAGGSFISGFLDAPGGGFGGVERPKLTDRCLCMSGTKVSR